MTPTPFDALAEEMADAAFGPGKPDDSYVESMRLALEALSKHIPIREILSGERVVVEPYIVDEAHAAIIRRTPLK